MIIRPAYKYCFFTAKIGFLLNAFIGIRVTALYNMRFYTVYYFGFFRFYGDFALLVIVTIGRGDTRRRRRNENIKTIWERKRIRYKIILYTRRRCVVTVQYYKINITFVGRGAAGGDDDDDESQ